MKRMVMISFFLSAPYAYGMTQKSAQQYPIIPQPLHLTPLSEPFVITPQTTILVHPYNDEMRELAASLVNFVSASLGAQLPIKSTDAMPHTGAIVITLDADKVHHEEGYHLSVTPTNIQITARAPIGAFWALQTVRQLMPINVERQVLLSSSQIVVSGVTSIDAPRFAYRGLHLDVSRHMFCTDDIKKYIDLLAFYKLNTFHWHLTDDQGWRIEIKKYPKLQEIGAYRDETVVGHARGKPRTFDGVRYGGYYTQEEVRDIVEYARKKYVTIIPEIELPGHCMAALAAYPELGCVGSSYKTATCWGIIADVYCAGNEKTFSFLEDVLTEVIDLFPSTFIHIGGDEVRKNVWKKCPRCQERMRQENLADENSLQSYFVRRIEKYINAQGRQIIGWDEILEGGISPHAVVMSWQGTSGAIEAVRQGNPAILTPCDYLYFNFYQTKPSGEPLAIGGLTSLKKVYDYEPVPSELNDEQARLILGVQANVWTEYIKTMSHVFYMTYPRALALAEIAWSAGNNKDYDNFITRVDHHRARLHAQGICCAH